MCGGVGGGGSIEVRKKKMSIVYAYIAFFVWKNETSRGANRVTYQEDSGSSPV